MAQRQTYSVTLKTREEFYLRALLGRHCAGRITILASKTLILGPIRSAATKLYDSL